MMTRKEALEAAERLLSTIGEARISAHAELAIARAEGAKAYIELARELRLGGEPRDDA